MMRLLRRAWIGPAAGPALNEATAAAQGPAAQFARRIQTIRNSGLFDAIWYLEKAGLPSDGEDAAITHYLNAGAAEGRRPHPLFEPSWYMRNAPPGGPEGVTLLEHYILAGAAADASPHPLFDVAWYRKTAKDRLPREVLPFLHFLRSGAVEGLSPHPLFDSAHYFSQDPGLAQGRINPLTHFVECGALNGLSPNPFFDVSWYLAAHPAVHEEAINPLQHFVTEGALKGANPHPALDLDRYIKSDSTVPAGRLRAYEHLLTEGRDWGRRALDRASEYARAGTARDAAASRRSHRLSLDGFRQRVSIADWAPPPATPRPPKLQVPAGVACVSFDIWDTLLRRDCHPDEIKLQSARWLLLNGGWDIKPEQRDARRLLRARLEAETASAPNAEFEYRFAEAIHLWLAAVLAETATEETRQRLEAGLLQHEFDAERRATRLDEAARHLLDSVPGRAIFASDFYMPRSFVERLLAEHGVADRFETGYVSSDHYETKRSGKLFQRITAELGLAPAELLHIGDNEKADVEVPARLEIPTWPFVSAAEQQRLQWFAAAFDAARDGDLALHEGRLLALIEESASRLDDGTQTGALRAAGARLAPLAAGYTLSIAESAIKEGADRVYFFTREGLLFKRAYDELARLDPYNCALPPAAVLAVSRRATFAASLGSFSVGELQRLWSLYSEQSIKALAVSLNLDETLVAGLARKHGVPYELPTFEPWRNEAVCRLLEDPELVAHAGQAIERQRHLLRSYLEQHRFFDAGMRLVADIGWRGSIQDNLAHLSPGTFTKGHYLGLFGFLNRQPPNTGKLGWLFDDNRGHALSISDVAPLEMIFNGPGGSVVGYEEKDGAVRPVTVTVPGEEAVIVREVAALQEGMIAALGPLANYIRLHGLTSADLVSLAQSLATSLCEHPPRVLAEAFARLHHNETFGTGGVQKVGAGGNEFDSLHGLSGSELHWAASRLLKSSRWPEGALNTAPAERWWGTLSEAQRAAVPLAVSKLHAPAANKAVGAKLAIYAPSPIESSGGHRTIFNLVRRLAKLGFEPHVLLEGIGAGVSVVEDYLSGTSATIHTSWRQLTPPDLALATIAHSARVVAAANAHHRGYLVQDFEALFNPMSDAYVTAENSYTYGLHHFTIGNWLSHVLNTRYGAAATPAGLGVDTSIYRPLPDVERERAICFLYQPDKPRRTPVLGIEALRKVKRAMPEVRIIVYGSSLPIHLDFEVENLGLVQDLTKLNVLYNTCTAGLCISGSNPSRIPFEMMAAGCVPVDLYRYNNLMDHSEGSILLAYQDSQSIAEALLSLLNDGAKARKMSKAAEAFAASRTLDWELDVIANGVLAMMDGRLPKVSAAGLVYRDPPFIAASSCRSAVVQFCDAERRAAETGTGAHPPSLARAARGASGGV